jgi:hypothetical protein
MFYRGDIIVFGLKSISSMRRCLGSSQRYGLDSMPGYDSESADSLSSFNSKSQGLPCATRQRAARRFATWRRCSRSGASHCLVVCDEHKMLRAPRYSTRASSWGQGVVVSVNHRLDKKRNRLGRSRRSRRRFEPSLVRYLLRAEKAPPRKQSPSRGCQLFT